MVGRRQLLLATWLSEICPLLIPVSDQEVKDHNRFNREKIESLIKSKHSTANLRYMHS